MLNCVISWQFGGIRGESVSCIVARDEDVTGYPVYSGDDAFVPEQLDGLMDLAENFWICSIGGFLKDQDGRHGVCVDCRVRVIFHHVSPE